MVDDFVHRFLPAEDATAPTLLVLHGTGGDENDLIPLARMISGRAAILSPRGRVLEHGMPRFFRRLAPGVFDEEDLRVRTRELADFVIAAADRYGLDPSRVYAVGYSNGANIAASVMLTLPPTLAGGVLLRPMVPFEPTDAPDLSGKPVLISAGLADEIVPLALADRLAELLQRGGARVTVTRQPAGHALIPREIEEAARWFAQYIDG